MRQFFSASTFGAFVFSMLYCFVLVQVGEKGSLLLTGATLGCLLIVFIACRSDLALAGLIAIIGLTPFFLSARLLPGLPKFYPENIVLVYLAYMLLAYTLLGKKDFSLGDGKFLLCIFAFFCAAFFSFTMNPIAETAFRNFFETSIMGVFLYLIFYNEVDERNIDFFIHVISVVVLILSILVCLEVVFQSNPLLTNYVDLFLDDFDYLDPKLHKITGAQYRPYAVFFHPSEAGTFIAMGFPFVFYSLKKWPSLLRYSAVLLVFAAIILNYTRGVWIALAATLFFCNFKKISRYLPLVFATGVIVLLTVYVTMGDTPFGKRIFDLTNFYNRLYYWKLGLNMFVDNFPFGYGHMNFENNYMKFIHLAKVPRSLDIEQIFVADNMFLTIMVEQGLLGIAAFLSFFLLVISRIISTLRLLKKRGDEANIFRLVVMLHALLIYLFAGMLADVHLFAKITKLFFIIVGMAFALCNIIKLPVSSGDVHDESGGSPVKKTGEECAGTC